MASITTRAGKGSPLTNAELDANFTNINDGITTAAAITGGTITGVSINNSGIGSTTPSTGAFTSIVSTSPSGVLTRAAATQDGVQIVGRSGGTSSYEVTLTPTTLTADRTLTLPNLSGTLLVDGGPLGTPSSGTVTNLTGTASININGTVGATTPNTGAFTTLTASSDSSFTSTGALLISKGTTGQQPGSPATGMLRYNTTTNQFEGYSGSSPAWNPVGGASLSNDTSTATNVYPTFAAATSGSATTLYTSNAKLLYKPSTGELQSSALVASNGLIVNSTTVSSTYTVATGTNALSVGPLTVASGAVLTVASGQRHIIL